MSNSRLLHEHIKNLKEQLAGAKARIKVLEDGLKPFAEAWRCADNGTGGASPPGICIYCSDKHFAHAAGLVPEEVKGL